MTRQTGAMIPHPVLTVEFKFKFLRGADPLGPGDARGRVTMRALGRIGHNEPFSPEPMAQGPGSARRCGKDGCGAGMARTGASHLASPRPLPRHHADPGQSGGLPGEKDSVSISRWGGRCGAGDRCEGAGGGGCAGVRGGRSRQGGGLRGAGGAVQSGGSGSVPCSSRCACRSRQGRSEAPAGARSARLGARGSGRAPRPPSAQGPAAAPFVQICCKGPDRAGALEEKR